MAKGKQKQKSTYVYTRFRSVARILPTVCHRKESVSAWSPARRSHQVFSFLYLSVLRVSIHDEQARNAERCARHSAIFIAPKSHYSHWVSTRWMPNSRYDPRWISCRKFTHGPIAEFTPRWRTKLPKTPRMQEARRKSSH